MWVNVNSNQQTLILLQISISKNVSKANLVTLICIRSDLDQKILPFVFQLKLIGEKQSSDNNLGQIFHL